MIESFSHDPRTPGRWRYGAAIVIVLALWPAGVLAQGESNAPSQPDPAANGAKASQGTPAVVLDDHGIESLLGKEVKNASGDKLGRVVDVLVSRDGALAAAVIDFGGFLGVGTRKVAVSWPTLRFSDQGPVLNMTTDELRVTPEYRPGEPIVVVGPQSDKAGHPASGPPPANVEPAPAKSEPPPPEK